MNNALNYMDIDINIENNTLCQNEETILNIDIKNKSKYKLENGLFKCILDNNILQPVDEDIYTCINNFDFIGDIDPGYKISIRIPLKVNNISVSKSSEIMILLNFHTIEDEELIDINYTSNSIYLDIVNIEMLKTENLIFTSSKDSYHLEEDIDLSIVVKNTTSEILQNLKLYDYIPLNTILVENTIDSTNTENIIINNENIIIDRLNPNESIKIFYKVYIEDRKYISEIKTRVKLNYKINNKDFYIKSNYLSLKTLNENLFDDDMFIYNIDKNTAYPNEIITHNITLRNNFNIDVFNVKLKNNFFDKFKFINNSLIINNIHRINENINEDIIIGDLDYKDEINISFKTMVISSIPEFDLFFTVEYETLKRGLISQESNINPFKTLFISFDEDGVLKQQSKDACKLNEVIDFSIIISNSGNTSAKDVFVYDRIPKGFDLIPGSIYCNDINLKDISKIHLQCINPSEKIIINYKAKATSICTNEESNCFIEYVKDPVTSFPIRINSNINKISVIGAQIGNNNFKKELSSYSSKIGDIITAVITIENTGNICCESLKLYENKNPSIEILENSLEVNGVTLNEDITIGINFEKIQPFEKIILKYQFKIINIPRPNPIQDKSILEYAYIYNEKLNTNKIYSTRSKLYVNNPLLKIIDKNSKLKNNVTKKYMHINEPLLFNIDLENIGNVAFENMLLSFNSPNDLIIDFNSIKINNYEYKTDSLSYIKLPNINVSQKIYFQFYGMFSSPPKDITKCNFYIDYTYKDLKNKENINVCKKYMEEINILNPDLEITKFLLDSNLNKNQELVKNINIKNTGNILLKNIQLNLNENDYLKNYESSVFINDNYEPKKNVLQIEKLEVDETINIAIRYSIDSLPNGDKDINESEVYAYYSYIDDENLLLIKRKSQKLKLNLKDYTIDLNEKYFDENLIINTKSTYMLNISNNGNTKPKSATLKLIYDEYVDILDNTIFINGESMPFSNEINLGPLNINENINVKFDFRILQIPYNSIFKIDSEIKCEYIENNKNITKYFNYQGNNMLVNNIGLDIVTFSSHEYLQNGDILTIQTILNNTGNADLYNIDLLDNLNQNLVYKENSTSIDGVICSNLNPEANIHIPLLKKQENILISNDYYYKPKTHSKKIIIYTDVSYSYKLVNDTYKRLKEQSNKIYIEGALSTFKQFNIDNEYKLKDLEPDIYEIINVFTDSQINEFYEVKPSSNNNLNVNNRKVVIKGYIIARVEYLSAKDKSSLYMLERDHPFTVFINIPQDIDNVDLNFQSKCDNVFYKITTNRCIFISSLITIEGLI